MFSGGVKGNFGKKRVKSTKELVPITKSLKDNISGFHCVLVDKITEVIQKTWRDIYITFDIKERII